MGRELPKGDIPLLVLSVLTDAPRHGYAIAREIERRSGQSLTLREGALYPALRVLEQDGLVQSNWEVPVSGPARKVYALTEAGKTELSRRAEAWQRYARTMETIIAGGDNGETQPI